MKHIENEKFNKHIINYQIERYSLVFVDFGEVKHIFLNKMNKQGKEDCFNQNDCPYGLNVQHEFSYPRMAFLVSNKLNDTVAVVPLTEYKIGDDDFHDKNIILDIKDFGLTLSKKSTVKLDQLRFIDKSRISKVIRKTTNKTLRGLLEKKIQALFS